MDRLKDKSMPVGETGVYYQAEISISAQTGAGMDGLLRLIEEVLTAQLHKVKLLLPYDRGELVSTLFEAGSVEHQEHTEDGVVITVQLSPALYERFKQYQVIEGGENV
jgi:GTP-binding protein HflX